MTYANFYHFIAIASTVAALSAVFGVQIIAVTGASA
jgi:hypothetical protein